jgi:hypothetical protein
LHEFRELIELALFLQRYEQAGGVLIVCAVIAQSASHVICHGIAHRAWMEPETLKRKGLDGGASHPEKPGDGQNRILFQRF